MQKETNEKSKVLAKISAKRTNGRTVERKNERTNERTEGGTGFNLWDQTLVSIGPKSLEVSLEIMTTISPQ